MVKSKFEPLSYDLMVNTPESNAILGKLINGGIKILPLFQCDRTLFEKLQGEVMAIVTGHGGQALEEGHPTFDYIAKWDPAWRPKAGTIFQYSLFNSKQDFLFFDEDHHWFPGRRFHPALKYVPEFFRRYFLNSELQNVRIQAIAGGGDLGQHRERIIAIPNREHHYKLRFHLPIVTNPGVKFIMDGRSYTMASGWVYLFNQWCRHGVANEGAELRAHLYWDFYLNDYIANELIAPALQAAASLAELG
jgi:hypothetical protein